MLDLLLTCLYDRSRHLLFFLLLNDFVVHLEYPWNQAIDVERVRLTPVRGVLHELYQLVVQTAVDVTQLLLDHRKVVGALSNVVEFVQRIDDYKLGLVRCWTRRNFWTHDWHLFLLLVVQKLLQKVYKLILIRSWCCCWGSFRSIFCVATSASIPVKEWILLFIILLH